MPDVTELGRKVKAKYPGQYDDLADDEVGRRVKTKFPGAYDDFAEPSKPATVLPQDRQEFGRRPATLDQSLRQSARINRGRGIDSGRMIIDEGHQAEWDAKSRALGQQRQKQAQEEFARKPLTEQLKTRATDALTRGGGQVSRMARQTAGTGLGVARGLAGGDFTPVDLPEWRKGEEGRFRSLDRRRESRPSSFATETFEGALEALPAASLAALGGIATGGSLPAAAAIGGGMAASGADWQDPKRAAVQTALGAVAPMAGGVAGSRLGSAVASRLARPAAQGASRAGGEVLGGAAGNVIGSGAEQLGFEGGLNARELAKQGIIGGALNVPGAASAAKRPARLTQDIPAAQPVTVRQPEAAPVAPRVQPEPIRQTAALPRPPARQTAEIPAVPTAPTRQIEYPDAPETQEMPAIRERIAAENAPTRELPQPVESVLPQVVETKAPSPRSNRPPKATDENIQALRSRQEELGREAYDRRGDFTGDLRDEYNRLNSIIREYDNARAPRELAPPPSNQPERFTPPAGERQARRDALQPKTGPMPETLTEGRPVTQEMQIPPALKSTEAFSSREDARQGHFERFNDEDLVSEIARLEDVRNQGLRGRSKLTREQLEANNFDLKIAVEMQKDRRRLQQQIGVDPVDRIAPRTPGRPPRKIQHTRLGEVVEAPDQQGVPKGKLRVVDEATGKLSLIQNPRTKGNREAAFVKGPEAAPVAPMESKTSPPDLVQGMKRIARTPSSPVEISQLREKFPGMSKETFDTEMTRLNEQGRIALHRHDHPASLSQAQRDSMVKIGNDYFTAATFRQGGSEIMGMGFGGLQGMFKGKGKGKTPELRRLQRQPQQQPLFDAAAKLPWQDSVLAYYRANLLTNPVSRAADLGSTVINQFADAAARPISAAVDVFVSKLTRQRSITGPSLRGTGRAFGSIGQGMRDAREVLRTGKQPIDSGADDALYGSEIRSGLGKGFDAPVNGVFRVLGAMDAPFRRFGFERNLADRARVAAINEAKAGRIPRSKIKSRAAALVDRDDVINAAVRDGEKAVLADPNRISSWLAKQAANNPNARLAIGIVQPFMRIPLNAILKSADFAGIGGVKALYKIARGAGRKARGGTFFKDTEEQRVFVQNVAAGSFAPAAFLLGMELEERGKLEGYYYTSKKDFPRGRTPTSIEIGGERYDVDRLGGFVAAPLFIGATYNRLRKQNVSEANALLRSFSGLAQQTPGLGYYGAPAKASRILAAEEPGEEIIKEAGSIGSGFIPASGALGAAAKAMDQNRKRETPGFTGPIMDKIPGLRGQLPERKQSRNLSFIGNLAQEFRKHGLDFSRVDRIPGDTEETHRARGTKVEGWISEYGGRLIAHPKYKTLTPPQQKAALENLRRRIGEQANQRRPDLRNFRPMEVFRSVRESERERPRRDRGKLVVAAPD